MRRQIFLQLLLSALVYSQGIFEPVNSEVYDFLERQSLNGNIFFSNEIKPVTRIEIARLLIQIEEKYSNLTSLDKELLKFYKIDFSHEIHLISIQSSANSEPDSAKPSFFILDKNSRLRLFEYAGNDFSFFADPMLSLSLESIAGEKLTVRRNGLTAYGYVLDNWSYNLGFYDNEESGKNLDVNKVLTPERGTSVTKLKEDAFEYDVVNASIGYYWNTGSLVLGKEYFKFGNGRTGNIILSDKAPSFPFIRFDIYPTDWLRFFYFHGFLVSNVIDSSKIRSSSVDGRTSTADVPKFMAYHSISFYPGANISLTLGESMVYSEYFQPIYLIPVMFFRVADHYLSRGNESSTGNAQIFADASYTNTVIKSKFYGSLFIDELSFNSIFEGGNLSALGYTVGVETRDLVFNNSSFAIEYSRLNPFVYMNSVDAQTYANDSYESGHWIGSNGDIISFIYNQYLFRPLSYSTELNYIRKGKSELPEEQYTQPYPEFLYGEKLYSFSFEFNIRYRPFHPVSIQAYYRYEDTSNEETGRLPDYRLGKNNYFGLSLSYGF
jgi:hypothetical protein